MLASQCNPKITLGIFKSWVPHIISNEFTGSFLCLAMDDHTGIPYSHHCGYLELKKELPTLNDALEDGSWYRDCLLVMVEDGHQKYFVTRYVCDLEHIIGKWPVMDITTGKMC